MTPQHHNPLHIGFGSERNSAHTSRTMMLAELTTLLESLPPQANQEDYTHAIIEENLLGKTTASNRKETAKFLIRLYELDPNGLLFRVFRYYWQLDAASRPLLAGLYANARDYLLRSSAQLVVETEEGEILARQSMERLVKEKFPNRFSPASTLSISQNMMSSWKQIGYLEGRKTVRRKTPEIAPIHVAFALLLGYCGGIRDSLLFETFWTSLLHIPNHLLHELASQASQRGLLTYKNAGGIIEVDFSSILSEREKAALHEQN